MAEPRAQVNYRLSLAMLKELRETVKRLAPTIRNVNHAVEMAIHEWLQRNKEQKP